MMPLRPLWQRRGFACCLVSLLLLPASRVLADEPAFAWFPLDPGRRIVLGMERERTLRTSAGVQQGVFQGRSEVHVGARRNGFSPLARLESESTTGLVGATQPTISQRIEIYSSTAEQVLLHSIKSVGGADQQIRYEPPRVLLQAPLAKGSKWQVGELRADQLYLDLEAEVLGIESLEVGGRTYPRVLRVRYSGSASGRAAGAEIREGAYERVVWFAKGTGIVQETVRIDLGLTDEAGAPMTFTDVITSRQVPEEAPPKKSVLR